MATTDGTTFLQQSENRNMAPSPETQGIPQPALELPHDPAGSIIPLPAVSELPKPAVDFYTVLENRRTWRRYSDQDISLPELAYLLWCTQGVKRVTSRPVTMRMVPSGGARHPFETYLVVSRVTGLEPGMYRYLATGHSLLRMAAGPQYAAEISAACLSQSHVRDCPVSFWWGAVAERATWRYGTRGYRYMLIDAGHICQNLYLAAESIDCGICAIGAFDDAALNAFWGVDGVNQFFLYGATLGKKPAE
jgi:SagB-type dehydrogenase family enzyme